MLTTVLSISHLYPWRTQACVLVTFPCDLLSSLFRWQRRKDCRWDVRDNYDYVWVFFPHLSKRIFGRVQQVNDIFIVQLYELGLHRELGRQVSLRARRLRALVGAGEEVADGARDDPAPVFVTVALALPARTHGVGLARASLKRKKKS